MKESLHTKSEANEIFNVAAMEFDLTGKSHYEIRKVALDVSDRFLRAAGVLPCGECLGWQLSAGQGETQYFYVFSDKDVVSTSEDINWIFNTFARVRTFGKDALDSLNEEGRRVYALSYETPKANDNHNNCQRDEFRTDYYVSDDDGLSGYLSETLDILNECGAIVRFTADRNSDGQGTVLLSLPDEMSLRLRTILSIVFTGTAAVEITEEEQIGCLPGHCMAQIMSGLLKSIMYAVKPAEDEDSQDDEFEEEGDDDSGVDTASDTETGDDVQGTPIETLDLSVRSFNCLRRAGIDTVEKLRTLTDEDIRHIRNLGRKSVEEIERKLSELADSPVWGPCGKSRSETLDDLIGLQNVKEHVRKITAFAKMGQDMAARGMNAARPALNMEFVGNPGTAKTTVARIIADMFHEIGLLSDSEPVEVGRADLIAHYVGQTADKVREVFRKAKGRLLFIDEAYSLVENWKGEYGDEAINTIVQEMENRREETIVVFAGYPKEMEEFFSRNPGLRSRVPFRISFSDYSPEEMVQIAELEAKKRGFEISDKARERVFAICRKAAGDPNAGNGRFCRNLIENAVLDYASRVYGGETKDTDNDFILAPEDFSLPEETAPAPQRIAIGFRS